MGLHNHLVPAGPIMPPTQTSPAVLQMPGSQANLDTDAPPGGRKLTCHHTSTSSLLLREQGGSPQRWKGMCGVGMRCSLDTTLPFSELGGSLGVSSRSPSSLVSGAQRGEVLCAIPPTMPCHPGRRYLYNSRHPRSQLCIPSL